MPLEKKVLKAQYEDRGKFFLSLSPCLRHFLDYNIITATRKVARMKGKIAPTSCRERNYTGFATENVKGILN